MKYVRLTTTTILFVKIVKKQRKCHLLLWKQICNSWRKKFSPILILRMSGILWNFLVCAVNVNKYEKNCYSFYYGFYFAWNFSKQKSHQPAETKNATV